MKITDAGAAIPPAATIAVANGHAPDLPERPYRQDQPCPPWCRMVIGHLDHERPEDRIHMSPITDVTLTLEAADVVRFPDGTSLRPTSRHLATATASPTRRRLGEDPPARPRG